MAEVINDLPGDEGTTGEFNACGSFANMSEETVNVPPRVSPSRASIASGSGFASSLSTGFDDLYPQTEGPEFE